MLLCAPRCARFGEDAWRVCHGILNKAHELGTALQALNLSLLTSDIYAAGARVFLFESFSLRSGLAFGVSAALVMSGLAIYHLTAPPESAGEALSELSIGASGALTLSACDDSLPAACLESCKSPDQLTSVRPHPLNGAADALPQTEILALSSPSGIPSDDRAGHLFSVGAARGERGSFKLALLRSAEECGLAGRRRSEDVDAGLDES
jgi:hypothetical protein